MKAVMIHQHGGPEVLRYEDTPDPQIKANEALIRVRACSLNHLDLFVRAGIPGVKFTFPHVLGSDIAGEVVRIGDLCERVKPGMRVLLSPGVSCVETWPDAPLSVVVPSLLPSKPTPVAIW